VNDENDREAAWLEYRRRLGALTYDEEKLTERAFKAGWLLATIRGEAATEGHFDE
jgi:hypothetical protein